MLRDALRVALPLTCVTNRRASDDRAAPLSSVRDHRGLSHRGCRQWAQTVSPCCRGTDACHGLGSFSLRLCMSSCRSLALPSCLVGMAEVSQMLRLKLPLIWFSCPLTGPCLSRTTSQPSRAHSLGSDRAPNCCQQRFRGKHLSRRAAVLGV